jgi:caffeoyl-CoA O-methyltransferase
MITTPIIESYLEKVTTEESELLKRVERETYLEVLLPNMISGHVQGRFLSMISKMIQPKRVLEIGTFTGYSALCLAEGIQENGELITLDVNDELEDRVNGYFKEANFPIQFEMKIGPALETMHTIEKGFDLIFIDADKRNYQAYYEKALEWILPNKFILIDNTLWKAKVATIEPLSMDKDTAHLNELNEKIKNDNRVEVVVLPLRDGLTLIRKK